KHFAFIEPPFSMTPDPRFLYLGEAHRDAMAHLLYGVGEGGGFVQLTGEVGTGKTTLCRSLFERLPADVDLAVILNPRQTDLELLATVCDELHVSRLPEAGSRKALVDALDRNLLDAHRRGRRTVLLIDEAQDLAPEVFEQVRLLTNLETSTDKLLKIILIGQPELITLLQRRDLRQVAQRVTARYHLRPFGPADTKAYVLHRLAVAGRADRVFSESALRVVHRASGGIPRLINSIGDRALLGAYSRDERRVSAGVARRAAREVAGVRPSRPRRGWAWAASAAAALVLAGAGALVASGQLRVPSVRPIQAWTRAAVSDAGAARPGLPTAPVAGVAADGGAPVPREHASPPTLGDLLSEPTPAPPAERGSALRSLYALWRVEIEAAEAAGACDRGRVGGLQCMSTTGGWSRLRRLDLPAVIEMTTPGGERRYATVVALSEQGTTLDLGGRRHTLAPRDVDRYWEGTFTVLWRVPELSAVPIVPGARGKDVEWLRRRMDAIDGRSGAARTSDLFDRDLRARVIDFQRSASLVTDGIVGEETLTHLSEAARDPGVPRLWRPGS
ncbi:MAG: AAA family ATPase, partial [Candidatus Rokuibacteriota bacterium]